jgi:hypothetical protein
MHSYGQPYTCAHTRTQKTLSIVNAPLLSAAAYNATREGRSGASEDEAAGFAV